MASLNLDQPEHGLDLDEHGVRVVFAQACPGVTVHTVERLDAGYTTRHWLLRTAEGLLLLKVPVRNTDPRHLQHLVKATTTAARAGVAVPRYRALLEHCPLVQRPVLVQQYLPGARASMAWPDLDQRQRHRIAAELGRAVGLLHTLQGDAFADLDGEQVATSWTDHVRDRTAAAVRALTGRVELAAGWWRVEDTMLRLAAHLPSGIVPTFTHNDLYLDNVVVDGGSLRCLLDFEHSRYNDRYADFGKLDELVFGWFPETTEPFLEAYRDLQPPAADEDLRLRVSVGLHNLVSCAYFHRWTPSLVPEYLRRIEDWLRDG